MTKLEKIVSTISDRLAVHEKAWQNSTGRFDLKIRFGEYIYLTALVAVDAYINTLEDENEDIGTEIFEMIVSGTLTVARTHDIGKVPSDEFLKIGENYYFLTNYEEQPETYKEQTDWSSAANLILLRDAVEAITGLTVHRKK